MELAISIMSMLIGFFSAVCWIISSFVKVDAEKVEEKAAAREEMEGGGLDRSTDQIVVDGKDLAESLILQSRWNSAAALLAAATILIQMFGKLLA